MPFAKKIEVENGILGIWELSESVESLIADFQFSENEEAEFKKFLLKKRQSEYIATRLLLQQLRGEKTEIVYQNSGRPQIKNSAQNISISHSAELAVIFISNDLPGIDVENASRNIDKVVNRFLHKTEFEWIEKSENPKFLKILFWCAKEAIYKCACQSGIQFDTQIFIPPFEFSKTDFFRGKLIYQHRVANYNLWYFYFQSNIIVYCVEVKNSNT
jgi:phosphopantetheinyl transferase